MDDIMSFLIEMEESGLLSPPPSRVTPIEQPETPLPRRGKRAAKAKRERATT